MTANHITRLNDLIKADFLTLAEETNERNACITAGNRLLVSAVMPYYKPSVSYLTSEHNVEQQADGSYAEISVELNTVLKSAHGALIHSFALAHNFCTGGLLDVEKCLRLSIAVRTTPNFANLGYIQANLRIFAKNTFDQKHLPSASIYGVAALPGQTVVNVEAEYQLRNPL